MRVDGGWFQFARRPDGVRLYSTGADLPVGFTATGVRQRIGDWRAESGYRDIGVERVGPVVIVSNRCVWKDTVWGIGDAAVSDDPVGDTMVRLVLWEVPAHDADHRHADARYAAFAASPGIDWIDRAHVTAPVRLGEVAQFRVDVDEWTGGAPVHRRASWQRAGLESSPMITAERARHRVREYFAETGLATGLYRLDALEATRVRDGWRVWCPPPPADDPRDIRFGWAVFYVADDGAVLRSSTSQSVDDGAKALTNGFYLRNSTARRTPSIGPTTTEVGRD